MAADDLSEDWNVIIIMMIRMWIALLRRWWEFDDHNCDDDEKENLNMIMLMRKGIWCLWGGGWKQHQVSADNLQKITIIAMIRMLMTIALTITMKTSKSSSSSSLWREEVDLISRCISFAESAHCLYHTPFTTTLFAPHYHHTTCTTFGESAQCAAAQAWWLMQRNLMQVKPQPLNCMMINLMLTMMMINLMINLMVTMMMINLMMVMNVMMMNLMIQMRAGLIQRCIRTRNYKTQAG